MMKNMFVEMDKNQNGWICLNELKKYLITNQYTIDSSEKKIFEELLQKVDLNKDGMIDFKEFIAATIKQLILEKHNLNNLNMSDIEAVKEQFVSGNMDNS
jgi:Ca2+-binding EF-hand superfamily protein